MFSTPLTCCFDRRRNRFRYYLRVRAGIGGRDLDRWWRNVRICAIGSVESAITPTSVMTMLMTPAKIGRSMKKCGKFIPMRNAEFGLRNY